MRELLRRLGLSRKPAVPLTTVEYWVYLPGDKLPPEDQVFGYLLQRRPYATSVMNPIGPVEGRLFSDIRLHIGLALRSKNAQAFRPDLFDSGAAPTQEILADLADAKSFVKVRYLSETPLTDRRHIQVVTHLTDAIAEMANGKVIYDAVCERLMSRSELQESLRANPDATRPDVNTRVQWMRSEEAGRIAETRGLAKIGMNEWRTDDMGSDERVLVESVLCEAMAQVWTSDPGSEVRVEYFGDGLIVVLGKVSRDRRQVRILRESGT